MSDLGMSVFLLFFAVILSFLALLLSLKKLDKITKLLSRNAAAKRLIENVSSCFLNMLVVHNAIQYIQ